MRRIPSLPRFVGSVCGVLTLTFILSAAASAQEGAAKPASASGPLSRYAPRDGLAIYVEFAGLESHGDAWRKTAAYKMLNETTLGVMLEDMTGQLFERDLSRRADRRINGAELVKMIEHIARHGFVLAVNAPSGGVGQGTSVLVFRNAATRDVRAMFSRLMLELGGANAKPELSKLESGQQLVLMNGQKPGTRWAWWPEKDDLVIAPEGLASAVVVADVLAGKRPAATDHPMRLELAKPDNGMEPIGLAFLDPASMPKNQLSNQLQQLQLTGATQIDFRWGPSGDALMSILRLKAKKPRQGLLALFDQPTFDSKSLPPMPEGVNEFSVLSLDGGKTYDTLMNFSKLNPTFSAALDNFIETLRTKGRIQVRKDVMAHLGPKMVLYSPPATTAATSKAAAPAADAALPANPLGALLGNLATLPRYVLLIEVDDAKAFERSLDNLMIVVNRTIREQMASSAAAAPAPPAEGGEGAAPDAPRRKGPLAPEFKMMTGPSKSYVLSVPSELGRLPAGMRPTIRMGAKHVAIATSPELARQALEIKPGSAWVPADESAAALQQVSSGLIFLRLDDPREQMPQLLANLPGEVQKNVNAAIAKNNAPPAAAAAATPGAAQPAGGTGSGGSYRGRAGSGYGSGSAGNSAGSGNPDSVSGSSGSSSGSSGSGGYPGAAQPGADGGAQGNESLVFRIDPAKLPSASALKALLFPGTTSVTANNDEVRFVRRVAFPDISTPTNSAFMESFMKSFEEGRKRAAGASAGNAGQPATPGAGSSTSPSANSSAGARGESQTPRE